MLTVVAGASVMPSAKIPSSGFGCSHLDGPLVVRGPVRLRRDRSNALVRIAQGHGDGFGLQRQFLDGFELDRDFDRAGMDSRDGHVGHRPLIVEMDEETLIRKASVLAFSAKGSAAISNRQTA